MPDYQLERSERNWIAFQYEKRMFYSWPNQRQPTAVISSFQISSPETVQNDRKWGESLPSKYLIPRAQHKHSSAMHFTQRGRLILAQPTDPRYSIGRSSLDSCSKFTNKKISLLPNQIRADCIQIFGQIVLNSIGFVGFIDSLHLRMPLEQSAPTVLAIP